MTLVTPSVLFQDCPSRQEIQGSLKQVQKLLSAHEASYLQSLRNLKKKINVLQSSTGKQTTRVINSTCPKLDAPINGRKLGKSHGVGHEVHVLCDPGYELVGSESRVCQESLTWSGQQPTCRGESPALIVCYLALTVMVTFSSGSSSFLFPSVSLLFFALTITHPVI
ncbi:hypothetical protein EPR50_G00005160 [Perca flavescens]|uniref:Sushi domain-containing protein n=1 Tax=Perca flavescens TaxID=8167 RepID=A0A484DQS0_PERFV|nr:hypothetical protein EPR50_G00005160 [Perca flavescens]